MQQSLPTLPTLTVLSAVTLCTSFTLIFVGLLYLFDVRKIHRYLTSEGTETSSSSTRPPETTYSKDDPRVIVKRFISVGCTCIVVPMITWSVIGCSYDELLILFGLRSSRALQAIFLPLFLTGVVFAGQLALLAADGEFPGQQGMKILWRDINDSFWTLEGARSYIVGPVSEEWVFRACMAPLLLASGLSKTSIILCAPLLFGIGHIHHLWDYYNNNGADQKALKTAVLRAAFQFLYTTIFGWYSMFLFLRTGHILSPIIAHIFCNIMGFPDFAGTQRHLEYRSALVAAFIIGMIGFWVLLFPLTEPSIYQSAYWG